MSSISAYKYQRKPKKNIQLKRIQCFFGHLMWIGGQPPPPFWEIWWGEGGRFWNPSLKAGYSTFDTFWWIKTILALPKVRGVEGPDLQTSQDQGRSLGAPIECCSPQPQPNQQWTLHVLVENEGRVEIWNIENLTWAFPPRVYSLCLKTPTWKWRLPINGSSKPECKKRTEDHLGNPSVAHLPTPTHQAFSTLCGNFTASFA